MEWAFDGEVIEWRGPAPYFFVAMPESDSAELKEEARALIYWGQIPVRVVVGGSEFRTALFPGTGAIWFRSRTRSGGRKASARVTRWRWC